MGEQHNSSFFSLSTSRRCGWVVDPPFECLHPLSGGIRKVLGVSTLSRRVPQGAVVLIPDRGAQFFATLRAWDVSLAGTPQRVPCEFVAQARRLRPARNQLAGGADLPSAWGEVEVAVQGDRDPGREEQVCGPEGCAEQQAADRDQPEQHREHEVVAVEVAHETSLATKTKNSKAPNAMPNIKPAPMPRLIKSARTSARVASRARSAAGTPAPKAVLPPRNVAQASRPLTKAVPSEGLPSQRIRMVAIAVTVNQATHRLGRESRLALSQAQTPCKSPQKLSAVTTPRKAHA